jgi:hypothetical protein
MAGLYLVEPDHPEFEARATGRPSPRRDYARWVVHELVTTTFGLKRLTKPVAGPEDAAEVRASELFVRRRHYWALAREWYVLPDTFSQALAAPVGNGAVVVLFTEQTDPQFPLQARTFTEFARRSPRGSVTRLPHHPHDKLFVPGPVLDAIVLGVNAMVKGR